MPLHIMTKQLCMWTDDNIANTNMLFYPLYYDIISLISLKITQVFHLFSRKSNCILCFKIQNSIWITKVSDNGNSDNQGSTVCDNCICKSIIS